MKLCTKCHIEKDESEFYKNTNTRYGITINGSVVFVCAGCFIDAEINCLIEGKWNKMDYRIWSKTRKEKQKNWAKNNRERIRQYQRENRKKLYSQARIRRAVYIAALRESYVTQLLLRKGFSRTDILIKPELIDVQKNILKIKRITNGNTKTKNHSNKFIDA